MPDPVLAHLGSMTLRWYGVTAALGALAAYWLGQWIAKKIQLSGSTVADAFFWALPLGLVGARLWHVVGDFGYYRAHLGEVLAVWNGGLAIHGGLLVGGLTLLVYARAKKISLWPLLDVFAPMLALGEAIGRWGNYFNQELFGRPTSLPWGIPISVQNRPAGFISAERFHPTFLYESLGLLLITVLLSWCIVHRHRCRTAGQPFLLNDGSVFGLFLILAGIIRTGIEQLRIDPLLMVGHVRVPEIISWLMILIGAAIVWRQVRRVTPPHAVSPPHTGS